MNTFNNVTKPKRKIEDIEELYDLEHAFENINKKTKTSYTLKSAGIGVFLGQFDDKFNLEHIGEFINIKSDAITYIESKEFVRYNDTNKILKSHINSTFTYLKLHVSLISYEVRIQLFQHGIIFIKNCRSLADAETTIEKLLFEINNNRHKHLFYL